MTRRPQEPTSAGYVLVIGATSQIARAVSLEFAAAGYDLLLAGRSSDELERVAADIRIRSGSTVQTARFEALDTDSHAEFVAQALDHCGNAIVGAIVVFGLLGDSQRARGDFSHAEEIIRVNYLGAASMLTQLANHFEKEGRGFIVGISSVAGDRGRASNYIYGSAKGALSLFLQGLRNRLYSRGVHVLTVKPGFIDTRMTFGSVPTRLAADPQVVAKAIVRALKKRKDVIYVPWFWRYIMWAIRLLPEFVFKRTDL
ncbi:MAG: short-chain dehydrogenase [Gemmatimonas sp. SM23_52]|nr:MAG: short-chain dehydrogenase [Gemmatimonas sp. SM23_52]